MSREFQDQLFFVCVVGLIVLAALMLLALMRCMTLLTRERERTEEWRLSAGRWEDYAVGLEQWIAEQDPTLDEHFAQTPGRASREAGAHAGIARGQRVAGGRDMIALAALLAVLIVAGWFATAPRYRAPALALHIAEAYLDDRSWRADILRAAREDDARAYATDVQAIGRIMAATRRADRELAADPSRTPEHAR